MVGEGEGRHVDGFRSSWNLERDGRKHGELVRVFLTVYVRLDMREHSLCLEESKG